MSVCFIRHKALADCPCLHILYPDVGGLGHASTEHSYNQWVSPKMLGTLFPTGSFC